jgi:hypothetical protein
VSTSKRNHFVGNVNFSNTTAVGLDIAQITNMSHFIIWSTMILLVWVKMCSSTCTAYKLKHVNYELLGAVL